MLLMQMMLYLHHQFTKTPPPRPLKTHFVRKNNFSLAYRLAFVIGVTREAPCALTDQRFGRCVVLWT